MYVWKLFAYVLKVWVILTAVILYTPCPGARTADAIINEALKQARNMVNERLGAKTSGSVSQPMRCVHVTVSTHSTACDLTGPCACSATHGPGTFSHVHDTWSKRVKFCMGKDSYSSQAKKKRTSCNYSSEPFCTTDLALKQCPLNQQKKNHVEKLYWALRKLGRLHASSQPTCT